MVEETIHELFVSEEAKFDYAYINGMLVGDFGNELPPDFRIPLEIKEEIETYITIISKVKFKRYLRLTYIDEENDVELMFFIIRRIMNGNKQIWELVGVCEKSAWTETAEENGYIRNWYQTKIVNIPKERDWVLQVYAKKILDRLERIREIGEYDDYIEARETIARELSKQQIDGVRNVEVNPNRVKYHIKKSYYTSTTADEIIRQLDSIINRYWKRVYYKGLQKRVYNHKIFKRKLYLSSPML